MPTTTACQRLLAELRESAAIEEALGATRHHLSGQESDQQHADDATDEVDTEDVQRVVVAELTFGPNRERADDRCGSPTTAPPRVMTVTDGVIATRPAMAPGAAPNVVGFPSRIHSTRSSPHSVAAGRERIQEDRGCRRVGCQGGTGVEPEPAEPEQTAAKQNEQQVVRAHGVLLETDSRAEYQSQGQRRHAGDDFDDKAAGVVQRPKLEGANRPEPTPNAPPPHTRRPSREERKPSRPRTSRGPRSHR